MRTGKWLTEKFRDEVLAPSQLIVRIQVSDQVWRDVWGPVGRATRGLGQNHLAFVLALAINDEIDARYGLKFGVRRRDRRTP